MEWEPLFGFVDARLKGPCKLQHRFAPEGNGTRVTEDLDGILNNVKRNRRSCYAAATIIEKEEYPQGLQPKQDAGRSDIVKTLLEIGSRAVDGENQRKDRQINASYQTHDLIGGQPRITAMVSAKGFSQSSPAPSTDPRNNYG